MNRADKLLFIIFSLFGIILIGSFTLGFMVSSNINQNICFEENRVLKNQFLDTYTLYDKDKEVIYNSFDKALFMDFYNDSRLYFIEEDKLRDDLKLNTLTKVKWCYVPKIKEFRVRGISQ